MDRRARRYRSLNEGLITALAVGGAFIILGIVIVSTPDILQKTNAFFGDLTTVNYPLGSSSTLQLPVPAHPAQHIVVFTALANFILGIAILQIVILPLRLIVRSPIRRIAETVGNLVFWLGAAVVANVSLLAATLVGWFQFWAWLIILIGLSLIARFAVYFATKSFRSPKP
jgi:hypothetical protein